MTDPINPPLTGTVITFRQPGGYEVIEITERTVRPPAVGEVRIRVAAAAVNPTDIALRERGVPGQTWTLVPGMDAAGTIESVGSGVTRLKPGQQVMAAVMPRRADGGAQAQHIVVPAASVVPVPAGVSFARACTLPMNGLTALRSLELAELTPGQVLGVSGGAGLLAHYTIALAKQQGLTVIADAKPEDTERVRGYGADVIIARSPNFAAAIPGRVPTGAGRGSPACHCRRRHSGSTGDPL